MGAAEPSEAVSAQREQLAAALDAAMGIYVNTALKALLLSGGHASCIAGFLFCFWGHRGNSQDCVSINKSKANSSNALRTDNLCVPGKLPLGSWSWHP